MTATDFKRAFDVANNDDIDLSDVSDSILCGLGLPSFTHVTAEIKSVAKFIRWQARFMGGGWDNAELTELQSLMRKRVTMVG